ncbi:MAG: hypothetical protein COT21_01200 [Hadesarchaea archaeon CG08_land_8_20_14_0_20_51_8]|nr:MAG: hypothetical protein COT21_01200 [Hadesarchaea archaeon CG08_land_8_20_14_0_20_51_8]
MQVIKRKGEGFMRTDHWGSVLLSILFLASLIAPLLVSFAATSVGTVAAPGNTLRLAVIDPPTYVYLIWTSDPAHTVIANWRTNENYIGQVRYGTTPGTYDETVEGTGGVTTNTFNGYIHHVKLTGLNPDTIYYFVCGNPDHGWSEELSFKTAPMERKDIRFVVGGDTRDDARYNYESWPSARDGITKLMASYNPDFVIFVGDYIWSGEYEESSLFPYTRESFPDTWDNWLGAWYKYARTSDNRLIPLIPVIGNHEIVYPEPSNYDPNTQASNYYMLFVPPGSKAYYSLNWGPDLHITILDSEIRDTSSDSWKEQTEWLGQDLSENHVYLWKISVDHRPALDDLGIQHEWTQEFDVFHLDLMFSGHQHYYERSHPINLLSHQNHLSSESFESPENGTIYVVSGGWGAPLNGGSNWYSAIGPTEEYHFTLVNIYENGTLQFKAINSHNEIIDNFTIQKSVQPQPVAGGIPILPVAAVVVIVVCVIVIFIYLRR